MVAAVPVVPYSRFSTESATWWVGRALHALVREAGLTPRDIDRLCLASFGAAPDTAIGLTQHFGLKTP